MDYFDKCIYCKSYDDFEGCTDDWCDEESKYFFKPNKIKMIEKSKENGISVADLIALINLH